MEGFLPLLRMWSWAFICIVPFESFSFGICKLVNELFKNAWCQRVLIQLKVMSLQELKHVFVRPQKKSEAVEKLCILKHLGIQITVLVWNLN